MIKKIQHLAEEQFNEIQSIRHYLHEYPELSFNEYQTSEFICRKLKEYNIPFQNNIVKTGILAAVKGKNPDKRVIALRADMDALPIQEENDIPYKSKKKGIMHACGHDVHSACLLGAANILRQLKQEMEGTVLLIFQPGEELIPGGAKLMLEQGIFRNTIPELIIAQHVMPEFHVGTVGFKPGMYMASCDEIYITVKGKGGHAATPDLTQDTVLAASQLIVALKQRLNKNTFADIPTILSFGKIIANGATNVIPNEVKIEGTFRTMNENWRQQVHEQIAAITNSLAQTNNLRIDLEIRKGYPVLINDEKMTDYAVDFSKNYLGQENIINMDIRMTSEDFAYFSQKIPAVFYRLGVGNNTKNIISPVHSATFNIDEEALKTGAGLMAWLAVSFLKF